LYCGRSFFKSAITQARQKQVTMDTLVSLGVGVAFSYSAAVTLTTPAATCCGTGVCTYHISMYLFIMQLMDFTFLRLQPTVYYDAASMITALVLTGRLLEQRARSATVDATTQLAEMQPHSAHVQRDGQFQEVAIEVCVIETISLINIQQVNPSDVVLVRPGERAAVDGVVISGTASFDESLMTGESVPVVKQQGDNVSGGTLNVSTGAITMRATSVGAKYVKR